MNCTGLKKLKTFLVLDIKVLNTSKLSVKVRNILLGHPTDVEINARIGIKWRYPFELVSQCKIKANMVLSREEVTIALFVLLPYLNRFNLSIKMKETLRWLQNKFDKRHWNGRVATNLENMENSGNLKNCQNLRENSGNFFIFVEKPGKRRENIKHVT